MLENYSDVLDIADVCKILRITKGLAYKLVQSGELPARKVGYRYRIPKHALINYINGVSNA